MIQNKISCFVKHIPGNKIEFMGYIWPANLIQPDYIFDILRHPTIMQCLEYVLGVDLFFCFDGLHKDGIDTEKLYMHLNCIKSYAEVDRGKKMAVESIEKYTAQNMEDDFLGVYDIAFKIYDDIVKDIYIGILPAGKDNTIPRGYFLEWLGKYSESEQGPDAIDYSKLTRDEQRDAIRQWKAPGHQHLTNKEICLRLWPDEAISLENLNKHKKIADKLTRQINRLAKQ